MLHRVACQYASHALPATIRAQLAQLSALCALLGRMPQRWALQCAPIVPCPPTEALCTCAAGCATLASTLHLGVFRTLHGMWWALGRASPAQAARHVQRASTDHCAPTGYWTTRRAAEIAPTACQAPWPFTRRRPSTTLQTAAIGAAILATSRMLPWPIALHAKLCAQQANSSPSCVLSPACRTKRALHVWHARP